MGNERGNPFWVCTGCSGSIPSHLHPIKEMERGEGIEFYRLSFLVRACHRLAVVNGSTVRGKESHPTSHNRSDYQSSILYFAHLSVLTEVWISFSNERIMSNRRLNVVMLLCLLVLKLCRPRFAFSVQGVFRIDAISFIIFNFPGIKTVDHLCTCELWRELKG